jgi:hypothetical protein
LRHDTSHRDLTAELPQRLAVHDRDETNGSFGETRLFAGRVEQTLKGIERRAG